MTEDYTNELLEAFGYRPAEPERVVPEWLVAAEKYTAADAALFTEILKNVSIDWAKAESKVHDEFHFAADAAYFENLLKEPLFTQTQNIPPLSVSLISNVKKPEIAYNIADLVW